LNSHLEHPPHAAPVTAGTSSHGDDPVPLERWLPKATLVNGVRHFTTELDWLRELRAQVQDPSVQVPLAWREFTGELLQSQGDLP
jgi:hypothetical protein